MEYSSYDSISMVPFTVGDLNRSPAVKDIKKNCFFYITKMTCVAIRLTKSTNLTIISPHYNFFFI